MSTWILVAHRGGARLLEWRGLDAVEVESIEHPEGKLKARDIDSDKPGRVFDRFGPGRHATSRENEATQHVADVFAKSLGVVLEKARTDGRFTRLVLVAEPQFLGRVRAALSPQTAKLIVQSIDKDLGALAGHALTKRLRGEVVD